MLKDMFTAQNLLTQGLLSGFAGKSEISSKKRSSFAVQASHFQTDVGIYHDEWVADRVGGGQELVKTAQGNFTRVYGGGTITEQELAQLGISKMDVMHFLVDSLNKYASQTRGDANCEPPAEADWQYQYQVLEKNSDIPYTLGKEEIFYQNHLVFVHLFINCPIE